MVFKDVSTFDAENPIVGSLLNELDLKKKGTGSDFMKNLPSQPGKDFEIIKSLDRLKGITPFLKDNNNNNNNSNFATIYRSQTTTTASWPVWF